MWIVGGISLILLFLVGVGPAKSATYYIQPATGVDDTNCGTTIGDACATWGKLHTEQTPNGGDTVCLLNSGTDELNEAPVFQSSNAGTSNSNRLIIDGQCAEQTNKGIIDGTGVSIESFTGLVFLSTNADFITLQNLEIRDADDEDCVIGIAVGTIIDNLTVHNCGPPTSTKGNGIGFYNTSSQGNIIVRNSTITDTNRGGILCFQFTGGYFLFENNLVHTIGGNDNFDAIEAVDCPYVIMQDNVVHSVGVAGDLLDAGGNTATPNNHIVIQRNLAYRGPTVTNSKEGIKVNNKPNHIIVRHNRLHYAGMDFYEPAESPNEGTFKIYNNTVVEMGLDNTGNGGSALQWWNNDGPFLGVEAKNNALILSDSYLVAHQPLSSAGTFTQISMVGNAYKFNSAADGIIWYGTGGEDLYDGDASGYAQWRTDYSQEPDGGLVVTQSLSDLFIDAANRNFNLKEGSVLIDAGTALTTTTTTGSGTSVPVVDSSYFFDGYGLTTGDSVQIGSNPPVLITAIDEGSHTLTLASSISWTSGDAVNLPYLGAAPDIGALEFTPTGRRRGVHMY